ncbi:MAG: hypothetical protein FGM32_05505 [Candidatus Kapabacteria bacterium]|nr:hypothetical protein [Candidatus Kapabacteria bacterium]
MKSDALLLVVTLLMQWVIGLGAVGAIGYRLERKTLLPLSLLLGMFLHSLSLFGAQLAGIPLSLQTMLVSGTVTMLLPLVRFSTVRATLAGLFDVPRIRPTLYDVVIAGFVGYVGYMVVWASWYWPVTPFDAMAGIDLVARYAAKDGMIANQVFTDPSVRGMLSNQPFYAPFAMLMQVMMKLIGYPYTQIWVSIVAISFWWFVWSALRRVVHPLLAGVLLVLFVLTPEMLGYSYILQTDFANAAFFSIGCFILLRAIDEVSLPGMAVAALAFAGACWSRTETPLLVVLVVGMCLPRILREFGAVKGLAGSLGIVAASSTAFALWNIVFFNWYLPQRPSTAEQLRGFDLGRFAEVVGSSWTSVISSTELWGWAVWLFLGVLIVDAIINRRIAQPMLIGMIIATFLGLFLVGTIFSAAIVEQTLRRGMFKVIPLMIVAIAGSGLVSSASSTLYSWEAGRRS